MGWNKRNRNRKPVPVGSAPYNIHSDIINFQILDVNTANVIDNCVTIEEARKSFYKWDNDDLAICPFDIVTGSTLVRLARQIDDIESELRIKKNYGYKA